MCASVSYSDETTFVVPESLRRPYEVVAQAVQEVEAGLFPSHPKMLYLVNFLERNSSTSSEKVKTCFLFLNLVLC
jgi:hypothetical protein